MFFQIKHLHIDISNTHDEYLKWKATYDREFKTYVMLYYKVLFCHFFPNESWPEPRQAEEVVVIVHDRSFGKALLG